MPKVEITKQLDRPDGGVVASGSIADSNPVFIESEKAIKFPTKLMLNQQAIDDGKQPVPSINEFKFNKLVKMCSDSEWDAVNDDSGAGLLVTQFYQEVIAEHIGDGFTNLIS